MKNQGHHQLLFVWVAVLAVLATVPPGGCNKAQEQPANPTTTPQTAESSTQPSVSSEEAVLAGSVVDGAGKGLSGIRVGCWYLLHDDFWYPAAAVDKHGNPVGPAETLTDAEGRYEIAVKPQSKYRVDTIDRKYTRTTSDWYDGVAGKRTEIRPLTVQAYVICRGRIVFEDGRPAANLPYAYGSRRSTPDALDSPPKTNTAGQFTADQLLPDEPFSLFLLPETNVMCVWKLLDPNSGTVELTARRNNFVELPSDWATRGTAWALSLDLVSAKDSRIRFSLNDLDGNTVSLDQPRFKGKAVIVALCGSWCDGCRQEVPYLMQAKRTYGSEGLEILGIAFERGTEEEQLAGARRFASQTGADYPILLGGSTGHDHVMSVIVGLENFSGYPTTIFIGRNGRVTHLRSGFWASNSKAHEEWERAQLAMHIRQALAATESAEHTASTKGLSYGRVDE